MLGDTVNTASRLESFDKDLDADVLCRILIGESTQRLLDKRFVTEPVGGVSLNGKEQAHSVRKKGDAVGDENGDFLARIEHDRANAF